jgi:hypothetical protein
LSVIDAVLRCTGAVNLRLILPLIDTSQRGVDFDNISLLSDFEETMMTHRERPMNVSVNPEN